MPTHSPRTESKLDTADQQPSPPVNRNDLLTAIGREPLVKRQRKLQRQHWTSQNYNSIQGEIVMFVEWVMAEEVVNANDPFLRYATRRAFVEDLVQLRVQIHGCRLSNGARICIRLSTKSSGYDDSQPVYLITNSNFFMPNNPAPNTTELRTLNVLGNGIENQNNPANIELQRGNNRSYLLAPVLLPAPRGTNPEESDGETYVATVEIVDGASSNFSAKSPPIEAVRWWAKPSTNLGFQRVNYTAVAPQIDGENFFDRVAAAIDGAGAAQSLYMASWSFNPYTLLRQGQNGLDDVRDAFSEVLQDLQDRQQAEQDVKDADDEVARTTKELNDAQDDLDQAAVDLQDAIDHAGDVPGATIHRDAMLAIRDQKQLDKQQADGDKVQADNDFTAADNAYNTALQDCRNEANAIVADTLAGKLIAAAGRGAEIYVLLDYFNAGWGTELLQDLQPLFGAHWNRVHFATSRHDREIVVGGGSLKKRHQIGSYHEKYVVVTGGGTNLALIGGIDAMPDRHSPVGHGWRTDGVDYIPLAFYKTYENVVNGWDFTNNILGFDELMLWHDIGVRVDGAWAVHYLAEDFVRRWNDAVPAVDRLPVAAAPPAIAAGTQRKLQLVKTDKVRPIAPLPRNTISQGRHKGTLDCHLMAIRCARHYIYFENQYVRDVDLRDAMCAALQSNPKLQIIVVIPFVTEEAVRIGNRVFERATIIQFPWYIDEVEPRGNKHGDYLQHQFITKMQAIAPTRIGCYGLAKWLGGGPGEMIYPHAKTIVVDDTWAYIGSANANGKSMKVDGESGYVIHDRAIVTAYRRALFNEHLNQMIGTDSIRRFRAQWDAVAIKNRDEPSDCTQAELANTAAVEIDEPPKGQKYNGPGSWLGAIDTFDKNV